MGEAASMRMQTFDVSTKIEPGEQLVSTNLTVTFELDQPRG
jgi:uncharacterized protein YggE